MPMPFLMAIRLRDDPPGRPCRVEAGWEDLCCTLSADARDGLQSDRD